MCFVHLEQSDLSGSHTLTSPGIFQSSLPSRDAHIDSAGVVPPVMEPKSQPKSKEGGFQDDCITPKKNARSYDNMESRSLPFNLAEHVAASTSSLAEFGREMCLESLPATPLSSSSTASSHQSDFWDTLEQKGPNFSHLATPLTPSTPLTSPISSTAGMQILEQPSPTPKSRSGPHSTEEAQVFVRAQNLVPTAINRTSTIRCASHNNAFREVATKTETISDGPALENSNPPPLRKPVQRRLYPHKRPGIQSQEAFEGLDVPYTIGLSAVTQKVERRGRSNSLPQERFRPREQKAFTKASKWLDVEDSIESSSTTPKVEESGSGDFLPQESPTIQKQEAHIKDSESLSPQDGSEPSSSDLKTERNVCDDSLQQKLTGLQSKMLIQRLPKVAILKMLRNRLQSILILREADLRIPSSRNSPDCRS